MTTRERISLAVAVVVAVAAFFVGQATENPSLEVGHPVTATEPACDQAPGSNCVVEPPADVAPPSQIDLDVSDSTAPAPQVASPLLGTVANGYLSTAELSPITGGHPSSTYPGTGEMRNDVAAAWNAAAVRIHSVTGQWINTNGSDSAYRPYARQVYWKNYWCSQGACQNAATPGTSNHGWGTAADVPPTTSALLDQYGSPFGWRRSCSDAPWENWHWHWCGGWSGKNPGPYGQAVHHKPPPLKRGADGKRVLLLTRKLTVLHHHVKHRSVPYLPRRHWKFDGKVDAAVRAFQRQHHLTPDGVVGPHTSDALRGAVHHARKGKS